MTENIYSFLNSTLITWGDKTTENVVNAMIKAFDEYEITPYSIDCRQSAIHDEDAISWQYTCEFDFGDYKISVSTHSLEHADEVVWMNFNNEYPVQIENQSIEDVGFYTRQFLSKKEQHG